MRRTPSPLLAAALLAGSILSGPAGASPSVVPTGTTLYDPHRAYGSDLLFTGADNHTHLIDMDGHELRRWAEEGFPARLLDPAVVGGARGVVGLQLSEIRGDGTHKVPGATAGFRNRTIGLVDWNDHVTWEWGTQAPGGNARQHHDWLRTADGHTLLLANQNHPIQGGDRPVLDDVVYDVAPDGHVAWRWIAGEHVKEFGFTDAQLQLATHAANPDYLHLNDMQLVGPNRWFRAGDTRFAPDNIIIDSREANFIAILDRHTGRVVWRLGPNLPQHRPDEPKPPYPVTQFVGQHDAHLIADGLPGAGNLLVFDNQGEAGYPPRPLLTTGGSRILEIDPHSLQVVWSYSGTDSGGPPWSFFSSFISSVDRLPNGNTLIDEGMNGRFFQVTPRGEIVWEYVSPFRGPVPVRSDAQARSNWVYRVQSVPYGWVPDGTPHDETAVEPRP